MKDLIISDKKFTSRLFLGTGKFGSNEIMRDAILASGTEMVTAALKRVNVSDKDDDMLNHLRLPDINFLPNTSGARNAKEAIFAAELAREALQTDWVKLEIHPDPRYLLPDPVETLKAVEILAQKGFKVMPYMQADPVLCKLVEEAGAVSVMPLAAPIGTNKGITNAEMLKIIIEQSNVPVVIDAGIGAPSHAALAMEMGADAVLINTAVAIARNPVEMAIAFKQAVEAGRRAFEAGIAPVGNSAEASSPLTSFLK